VRPYLRLLSLIVASSSTACVGTFEPLDGADTADASPDQAARAAFDEIVPILTEKACFGCHETGAVGAPLFGRTYDTLMAYMNAKVMGCTPAESTLYSLGPHPAASPGVWFDTTADLPKVEAFVVAWAATQAACQGGGGAKPRTGSIVFVEGLNTVDLSGLGPGLEGAQMTFVADILANNLLLTEVKLIAGAGGLKAKHPRFETCPMTTPVASPIDAFYLVDLTIPAAGTADVRNANNQSTLSITNGAVGGKLSIAFESLTPEAGSQGTAIDLGGACGL